MWFFSATLQMSDAIISKHGNWINKSNLYCVSIDVHATWLSQLFFSNFSFLLFSNLICGLHFCGSTLLLLVVCVWVLTYKEPKKILNSEKTCKASLIFFLCLEKIVLKGDSESAHKAFSLLYKVHTSLIVYTLSIYMLYIPKAKFLLNFHVLVVRIIWDRYINRKIGKIACDYAGGNN